MSHARIGSRRREFPHFPVERLEDRQLMSVTVDSSIYTVNAQAGTVAITLDNNLGPTPTAATQVVVSLGGGSAVPGVDYTPESQTVSFAANQAQQTIQIPILPGTTSEGTRTLEVDVSPVAGSAPTSNAFVLITHNSDTTPPTVVSSRVLTKGSRVTGFVITFSKAMDPGPVQDVNNFAIDDPQSLHLAKGSEAVVATRLIKLKSATYNSATNSVTLTTASKVKKFPFFSIMDRQTANELNLAGQPTAPTAAQLVMHIGPFTDTNGNPLSLGGPATADGYLDAVAVQGKSGNRYLNLLNQLSATLPTS